MKILLPLAALAATLTAAPAFAQPPASATIVVRTADLDLHSATGRTALDRRIRAAIDIACGDASDADVHGKNAALRCRAATRAQAEAQRTQAVALARGSGSTTFAAQ
jgi:UrcA family protein